MSAFSWLVLDLSLLLICVFVLLRHATLDEIAPSTNHKLLAHAAYPKIQLRPWPVGQSTNLYQPPQLFESSLHERRLPTAAMPAGCRSVTYESSHQSSVDTVCFVILRWRSLFSLSVRWIGSRSRVLTVGNDFVFSPRFHSICFAPSIRDLRREELFALSCKLSPPL